LQSWKARMRGVCTTAAVFSDRWCISLTMRTAKRQPSSDYTSYARISTLWQTIIERSFPHALTITGIKLYAI
jgi:hypothetical protein